jgi:pimeloyl-ACP methyl ester carboxylesterase
MDAAMFQEPRRRMIRLPDGEMAALDFGDEKRPVDVVFLHATGFNAMTYRSILAPLSPGMRILAVDQRGHGASNLPIDPPKLRSWKPYRDDLLALLSTLDGPPPVLSGHSMGGTVSLLAAAVRPAAVSGLVLFDPVVLTRWQMVAAHLPGGSKAMKASPLAVGAAKRRAVFDSVEAAFAAYKGRGAFRTWSDVMLADYVAGGFRERPDGRVELACRPAMESAIFANHAHNPWAAAAKAKAPIQIYRAEQGSTCRIGSGEAFFAGNRRSSLVTVLGSSHFLPMERPDIVRDALLDAAV